MATLFTKIINGEIPAHKIAETKDFLAFLDINPLREGHTLAIPKKEVDYLFDLDNDTYIGLHLFVRSLAPAILSACPAQRIGTSVIGLEVPHAHIHLVPIDRVGDMDWSQRQSPSDEELAATAERIRSYL